MTMFGGNIMGGRGSAKSVTLNDKLGIDGFFVKDNESFPVIGLMSNGDIQLKGRVTRTLTG